MTGRTRIIAVVAGLTLVVAGIGFAAVPAPPVNQNIGLPDIAFTETDCRACHTSGVPDRHHMLYGQTIPGGSVVPYPGAGTEYVCLSCHDTNFTVERDCAVCHDGDSPHHTAPAALGRDCKSCHGSVVDNYNDGHYIPTYAPSLVTPTRSKGDGLPVNSDGKGAGACNYCHDDGIEVLPDGTSLVILTNENLHHGTGLANCGWCHAFGAPFEEQIRACEDCHGPNSLHNIQADSPNAANIGTVVVGGEDAGYGHIGRDAGTTDSDCWGCHGFAFASAPGSGPVIPTLHSVDKTVVSAGRTTPVILLGSGLTNTAGSATFDSNVILTGADGSTVTLSPVMLLENLLAVTLPADLAPGNYDLQAIKAEFVSNPAVVTVVPQVRITAASGDKTLTITGSGFGGYAEGSGTSVTAGSAEATIVSWSDTTIVADFASTPSEITVTSLYGSATAEVGGGDVWGLHGPNGEAAVRFEPAGGFLSVEITYSDGSSSMALGIELDGVIYWMDASGSIYFGNISRLAGWMSGVVFGETAGVFVGEKR